MAALCRTKASTMSHSSRTIVTPASRIAISSKAPFAACVARAEPAAAPPLLPCCPSGAGVERLEQRCRARRIGLIHDLAGAALGRRQVQRADMLLDPGQPALRHRQLADPKAEQQPGEARIA